MDAQFENLCRICAANTKKRDNSVVESVFIFKTTGLKDKISRHLYLNVAEDDLLPKVLCKSCYRQVEATASLSNIAKHTQLVFRDFLLSTVPKNVREPGVSQVTLEKSQGDSANNVNNDRTNTGNDEFRPILLSRGPDASISLTATQKQKEFLSSKEQRSVTGAQTGLSSSSKTDNVKLPGRRNSVFVDSRYGSTPMSIAQRSMQQIPSVLAPYQPEVNLLKATNKGSPEKKHSPAGVINFIQTHGRITGNATPSISCGNPCETIQSLRHERNLPSTSRNLSNLSNNVLQQKRRNLKNALNNIKAKHSGQVSLLKSSQPNSSSIGQGVRDSIQPLVTTTVVPHPSLYGCETSVEEALPEHIIIAAPKKKKEESEQCQIHRTPQKAQIDPTPAKSTPSTTAVPVTIDVSPSTTKTSPNVNSLTDAISLGNVIRDPDLLKLILKALKWPVSSGNCEEQMTRLKNSKFSVIMSDRNLLQDTDLTQLLGPYLGPMLAVAQQNKQQKQSNPRVVVTAPTSPPKTITKDAVSDLSCTMPYKLPPETSLQLVPSSPTEQEPSQQQVLPVKPTVKRTHRRPRNREPPLANEELGSNTSNAARVASELLNINAMLLSQFGSNPADALNEALVSMLKQQQQETTKIQSNTSRRRSASSASTAAINLEDIVLVEPQPAFEVLETHTVQDMRQSSDTALVEQDSALIPSRPIIKRRKTVIQTSKQVKTVLLNKDCLPSNCQIQPRNESTKPERHTSNEPPDMEEKSRTTQVAELGFETPQAPTSTVLESTSSQTEQERDGTNGEATVTSGNGETKASRKSDVKSALGQKLLEAIGLPQQGKDVPPETSRDSLRSALKRSLKQAQEQQQQLKRVKQEPVKQMADSTTKPSLAESAAEEHKKAIAERELALLKRKSKVSEQNKVSVKDEKTERADVSSSSSRHRRNRKLKGDTNEEDSGAEDKKSNERWDEDDDLPLKTDGEKLNRPSRTSKTMSKYYKGPAMTTRSTRR